jgi:hypothetical protein
MELSNFSSTSLTPARILLKSWKLGGDQEIFIEFAKQAAPDLSTEDLKSASGYDFKDDDSEETEDDEETDRDEETEDEEETDHNEETDRNNETGHDGETDHDENTDHEGTDHEETDHEETKDDETDHEDPDHDEDTDHEGTDHEETDHEETDHEEETPPLLDAKAKIFILPASSLNKTHDKILQHLRNEHDPKAFVSPSDIICALAWLYITRARLRAGRISPYETTCFSTAVNIRKKLSLVPPISKDYIGNMWLRALTKTTVWELENGGGEGVYDINAPATTRQLAQVARMIRKAIDKLGNPKEKILERAIALAARATDPNDTTLSWTDVDEAIRRTISRHTTGVDVTVGVELGADVEFEIPGVPGGRTKPAWVRRAYVPFDGAVSVMPRRGGGGENSEADWEVLVALREEDLMVVEGYLRRGGYLSTTST